MIDIIPYLKTAKTFDELTSRYLYALRKSGPENTNVSIVLEEYLHKESKTFVKFVGSHSSNLFKKVSDAIPVNFEIYGRKKSLYSYIKKLEKASNVRDVKDVYGIRIVIDDSSVGPEEAVRYCYLISKIVIDYFQVQRFTTDDLGRKVNHKDSLNDGVTTIYIPKNVPQFIWAYSAFIKDYIHHPKPNGYQSIHLGFQKGGRYVDVQIRTESMHAYAEYGGASHDTLYKPPISYECLKEIHIEGLQYDGNGRILNDTYGIFKGLPIGPRLSTRDKEIRDKEI